MKKFLIILILLITAAFVIRFVVGGDEDAWICSNGEWVKHGNPRAQKPTSGCGETKITVTKTEEICKSANGKEMTLSDAKEVANRKCLGGKLKGTYFCNPNSRTWWLDFSAYEPEEGCNPACVVNVETKDAEINWRCTGLLPPSNN